MKILILGSSGVHITRWAEFFLEKGHEVVLVIGFDYQNEKMKIYRIGKKYGLFSFLANLMKLKRIIKDEKPDIVYTQYLTTYGVMAAMSGFKNLALSIIGSDIYTHVKKFPFNLLSKHYINRFKMINIECEGVKAEVLKYYKYPGKIVVKNWGVNFNLFNPSIDRTEIRKLYNISSNDKVVVSARALIPRCNVETVIRATNEADKIRNVKLLIVGNGESMERLKKLVKELNMKDVIFVGFVKHEDLGKYLRAGDIYAQASFGDTVSIAMLDAMACNVPCISSNVGCTSEFLKHDENGFLISNPTNYSEMAGYITRLLDDENIANKFAEESYRIVLTSCDENKNMDYIESEMKRLVLS